MISMNLVSHICFLCSLLFFVISGVVFLTMDVKRGWQILLGSPVRYTKEQKEQDKKRRKEVKRKAAKDNKTVELTRKIATEELLQETTTILAQEESEATTGLAQEESEATTGLTQEESEATTVLAQEESEATTVLIQEESEATTVLTNHLKESDESDFRILYEITHCSVPE